MCLNSYVRIADVGGMTGHELTYLKGRIERVDCDTARWDDGWVRFFRDGLCVYSVREDALISVQRLEDDNDKPVVTRVRNGVPVCRRVETG